jgi:hypothetical protein
MDTKIPVYRPTGKSAVRARTGVIQSKAMTIVCRGCGTETEVPMTALEFDRWRGGELIQNVLPHVPADVRELLLSGLCGDCFDITCDELE